MVADRIQYLIVTMRDGHDVVAVLVGRPNAVCGAGSCLGACHRSLSKRDSASNCEASGCFETAWDMTSLYGTSIDGNDDSVSATK